MTKQSFGQVKDTIPYPLNFDKIIQAGYDLYNAAANDKSIRNIKKYDTLYIFFKTRKKDRKKIKSSYWRNQTKQFKTDEYKYFLKDSSFIFFYHK